MSWMATLVAVAALAVSVGARGETGPAEHVARLASIDAGELRSVLERKLSPTVADVDGWTDLHWAAAMRLPDLAEALLDAGAKVDARLDFTDFPKGDLHGQMYSLTGRNMELGGAETPLHIAAQFNAIRVAEVLIARGADIEAGNWSDGNGWTALDFAVAADSLRTAALLFERRGGAFGKHRLGMMLEIAAYHGAVNTIALLLDLGADLHGKRYGRTPLQTAAFRNRPEAAALLLDHGAHIDARDEGGWTPLHFAAIGHHAPSPQVAEMLIERGARIDPRDDACRTPLHLAAGQSDRIVEALIGAGAEVSATTRTGQTPLHVAAAGYGTPKTMIALVESGAGIEAKDEDGRTPLHVAARDGRNPDMVYALLAAGADGTARDANGRLPFDLAKDNRDLRASDAYRRLRDASF